MNSQYILRSAKKRRKRKKNTFWQTKSFLFFPFPPFPHSNDFTNPQSRSRPILFLRPPINHFHFNYSGFFFGWQFAETENPFSRVWVLLIFFFLFLLFFLLYSTRGFSFRENSFFSLRILFSFY